MKRLCERRDAHMTMSEGDRLEKEITAAHELVEEGGFNRLPGMDDFDFDHCQCGLGWPMGVHHDWDCPAHCICGSLEVVNLNDVKKRTCYYHTGESGKMPIGPSVMTERWDLKPDLPEEQRGIQQNIPLVVHDTESETPSRLEGEEASGPPALSRMRRLPK